MVKSSQKIYRMKGCSKKNKNKKHRKKTRKHLGGSSLAYPTNNIFFQKPPLAYTGKTGGGTSAAYPRAGASGHSQAWLNSSMLQGGGQRGGNGLPYGQGLPEMRGAAYPNGLTGQPWGANLEWPSTTNIGGNNNHYSLNTYAPNDVSRQMIAAGANPPFSGALQSGGGKKNRRRKQRGGALSNFLFQDLVNVGRQAQFGLGSTLNTLKGYGPPGDPMPWRGQLDVRSRI
jgi:hypothetical protein